MKKLSTLVLSTLTAAFLVGCGGGSSTATTTTSSATDVTVERGAIWGATVIDSSTPAQTATQTSATSNVYTFASTPTYPIMATGGIIDLDGDATTTDDVYDFSGKTLISYSEVITPITNYLGNPDDADYQTKLDKLKEITGATNDDLLNKVPSETSTDILVLTNTLYDILNDDDDSNDDFLTDYDNSEFKTKFDDSKSGIDATLSLKEIAELLEDQVLSTLGITKLTSDEVTSKISEIDDINKLSTGLEYEEWPEQGPTTYSAMKTAFLDATNPNYFGYNNTTYIFNSDNTICEKDSDGTDGVRADYSTCSSSIGTWTELNETMIATMSDGGKVFEKIINGNVWTAYSGGTESDSSDSSDSSSSTTTSNLSIPTGTAEMVIYRNVNSTYGSMLSTIFQEASITVVDSGESSTTLSCSDFDSNYDNTPFQSDDSDPDFTLNLYYGNADHIICGENTQLSNSDAYGSNTYYFFLENYFNYGN